MTKATILLQEGQKVVCQKLSYIKIILFWLNEDQRALGLYLATILVSTCLVNDTLYTPMHAGHTDTEPSVSVLYVALTEKKQAFRGLIGRHRKRFLFLIIITRQLPAVKSNSILPKDNEAFTLTLIFKNILKPVLNHFR